MAEIVEFPGSKIVNLKVRRQRMLQKQQQARQTEIRLMAQLMETILSAELTITEDVNRDLKLVRKLIRGTVDRGLNLRTPLTTALDELHERDFFGRFEE